MSVGQSQRSIAKHTLLRKIIGKEVAVVSNLDWMHRYEMVDLTAGDGDPNEWSGTSSAAILLDHRDWLRSSRSGVVTNVTLVEVHGATHAKLKANYGDRADAIIRGDSREPGVISLGPADAVFINNDPNSLNGWALNFDAFRDLPTRTTTLSTVGCNAGGLRRMATDERVDTWRSHLQRLLDWLPPEHDALLVALRRDPARWAYVLTGPAKPRWRARYGQMVRAAFGPQELRAWYRDERSSFDRIVNEYLIPAAANQPQLPGIDAL